MPLVGTPTPPVTRTWSFFSGWFVEVPRISRVPSDDAVHSMDVGLGELATVGIGGEPPALGRQRYRS